MPKSDEHAKTVSAVPLFKRIEKSRGGKAAFAKKLDIDHGRLSNWKTRGIPWAQLKRVASALELTVDQYLAESGDVQNLARQPTGQYTIEGSNLLEDFNALPDWLQEHVAWKTAELRRYADALPAYVKAGMKGPPKDPDKHRAWERDIEADMAVKLGQVKEKK